MNERRNRPRSRLFRAFGFARPHRWAIGVILLLTFIVAGANALEPLVMKYIFDNLRTDAVVKAVASGVGLLVVLGLLREVFGGLSNWLGWRTRLDIHYGLLNATVERLHRLPHDIHRKEGVGAIMNRLDRGIQGFIGAISEISFNVLPALAYLVLAVIVMVQIDWRLTLLVLAFAPLPALLAAWAAPTQTRREQTLWPTGSWSAEFRFDTSAREGYYASLVQRQRGEYDQPERRRADRRRTDRRQGDRRAEPVFYPEPGLGGPA